MAAVKIKNYSNGVLLVANKLLSGRSVYFSNEQQWLPLADLHQDRAAIAYSEEAANELLVAVNAKDARCSVVDPYIIQLDGKGQPSHSRELLRATGPSIRYGLQATLEINDVSI